LRIADLPRLICSSGRWFVGRGRARKLDEKKKLPVQHRKPGL
jgi:hypothetical protein